MSFCQLCDDLTKLAATDPEVTSIYAAAGFPNPSALLTHAKTHSHPDLPRLTYRGSAIVAVADEKPAPAKASPPMPPPPAEPTPPKMAATPPRAAAEPVADEVLVTPPRPPAVLMELGDVHTNLTVAQILQQLAGHPDGPVAVAASTLIHHLNVFEETCGMRAELERLTVQRDQLTDQIEKLRAGLTSISSAAPAVQPDEAIPAATTGGIDMADVRQWARETGRPVKPTGKIAAGLVADYRAAMEVS